MEEWRRRSVLATGAALSIGTGLASIGAGAAEDEGDTESETEAEAEAESDVDELPDPSRDPGPNEDWPSHRGDPGHARHIEDGHEFEGEGLEAVWSVDGAGTSFVAIADETVYLSTEDGVFALDETDGSVVWENTDIDADTPSVDGEAVYLSGDEVVALESADGSVRWKTEFESEKEIVWQTAAYGGVYVVVDGTLYALDTDDGSVRWEKESITTAPHGDEEDEDEYEFVTAPAAANGVIYSVTGAGPIALDPETGDEVWQKESHVGTHVSTTYATSTGVAYDGGSYEEWPLYDAQTGEFATIGHGTREIAFGEEIYVGGGTDHGYSGGSIGGDEHSWGLDMTYTYGQAVISGDTAYAYFYLDGHNYGEREYDEELVALNKYDGSEKWTISVEDAPVGPIRAISGETFYVEHNGDLVALREPTDEDDQSEDGEDGSEDDQATDGDGDGDSDGNGDDEDDGSNDDREEEENEDEDRDEDGNADGDGDEDKDGNTDGDSDDTQSDGDDETEEDSGDKDDGDGADDGDDGGDNDTSTVDTDDDDTGIDGTPGFTTGAGVLSGALGLEWLRRRAGPDGQTDRDQNPQIDSSEQGD
ncbi:PQQ-binding-like beta-propeller repeat protein [Natrialba sp. SSL1]|uniref:outer membrane protein assembly factor BamB family protein n=1 Tax=Natrialba sp. SSL1 TaxID=1869245 RepID=UPI0008F86C80|nr:PQQ-binding-like beta-propeller repeat protein [Natrialba sp. SSL1]OIB58214.1 pyrrolo-quinoline quinone [Natrialba sp. SSL1]